MIMMRGPTVRQGQDGQSHRCTMSNNADARIRKEGA